MSQGDSSEDDKSLPAQSPLEVTLRDSFFTAIRNGSVEGVREILNYCTSDRDSLEIQGEEPCAKSGCLSRDGDAEHGNEDSKETEQQQRRAKVVNLVCPASGKSALFVAVESGHYEICEELLERGADPLWVYATGTPLVRRSTLGTAPEDCERASCLDIAVHGGDVEIVDLLIKGGAQVHDSTWTCWWDQFGGITHRMFCTLLRAEGDAVPIFRAWKPLVRAMTLEEKFEEIVNKLRRVNWIFGTYQLEARLEIMVDYFQSRPKFRFLLRLPAHGEVQQFYKSLLLQRLYVYTCHDSRLAIVEEEALLSMLIKEGVSVDGWTLPHTKAMHRAWLNRNLHIQEKIYERDSRKTELAMTKCHDLFWRHFYPKHRAFSFVCVECLSAVGRLGSYDSPERVSDVDTKSQDDYPSRCRDNYVTYFHPACFIPALIGSVSECSVVVNKTLLSHTKVGWLAGQKRIPMASPVLALHDGPTCSDHTDLSAEQKKVSLKMCTCSGGTVQSLMSLCRDVITTSCLEHRENVFDAVESLPLPARLKSYMLSN